MAQVKRPYGPWSKATLARLRNGEGEGFKTEAFIAWMDEHDLHIDRTLLSHWAAGRTHLPADLLPLLAEFTGRPEEVFAEYLHPLRCELVRLPRGRDREATLVDLVLGAAASLGRVEIALVEARSAESPGGVEITADERKVLLERVDLLMQQLADLRRRLAKV